MLYSAQTKRKTINVITPIRAHKQRDNVRSIRPNQQEKSHDERKIDKNNVHKRKEENKKKTNKMFYPLFVGVTYLAVDDVSIIESSYCSPSSLCFSTKKI